MGFGDIIKRAWTITWRYRALWVLGLFAGVAGGSSGGSSGSSYRSSNSDGMGEFSRALNPDRWAEQFVRFLPVLIAVAVLLVALSILFAILRIAARGGLVQAVDAIEQGHPFTLGGAWSAGFGRFWRLLGLSLLLGLPIAVVALGLGLAVAIPILLPLMGGTTPGMESILPMCGAFIIGVPLLIVGGVVLSIMQELGLRSIMLDDMGVFDAAGASWRWFRARIKDTLIMWFLNLGLNIVSGLVLAIPVVIIVLALIVPAALAVRDGSFATLIGAAVVAVLFATVLVMAYTAIWGTFTSTLWTVFFRRLTGREAPAVSAASPVAVDAPASVTAPEEVPAMPTTPPNAPEGTAL